MRRRKWWLWKREWYPCRWCGELHKHNEG